MNIIDLINKGKISIKVYDNRNRRLILSSKIPLKVIKRDNEILIHSLSGYTLQIEVKNDGR